MHSTSSIIALDPTIIGTSGSEESVSRQSSRELCKFGCSLDLLPQWALSSLRQGQPPDLSVRSGTERAHLMPQATFSIPQ